MADRILVTGAGSGLGKAIATRYAKAGWRVLVSDVDAAAAEATAKELDTPHYALNVTSDDDWTAAREWCEREWGGLDVLVNNAGVASAGRFERIALEDWDWIWEINLKGVVRGCRTFVPGFKERGSGHVVNVASMAAILHPPAMSAYNVVKSGVLSLSETLRLELEPYGVHTTVVCPGFVHTNLGDRLRTPDAAPGVMLTKLMRSSAVTADDVAAQVFDAVARKRFLLLTHREGRRAALLKRFFPNVAAGQTRKYWARLRSAMEDT